MTFDRTILEHECIEASCSAFTMSNDSSPEGSQFSLDEIKDTEVLSLPNLRVLEINDQIRELQTIIRDK